MYVRCNTKKLTIFDLEVGTCYLMSPACHMLVTCLSLGSWNMLLDVYIPTPACHMLVTCNIHNK